MTQDSSFGVIVIISAMAGLSLAAIQLGQNRQLLSIYEGDKLAEITINSDVYGDISNGSIFAATLMTYLEQLEAGGHHCNMTLLDWNLDLSSIDPAEYNDIGAREYTLSYDMNSTNSSLLLTITINDDSVAESDEVFVLYTNYGDIFNGSCAFPIRIIDDDWIYFNFSTTEIVAREGGANSNISVIKTGLNEPNISFRITPTQSKDESALMITETEYAFTTSTVNHSVHFTISDDNIYGNSGVFHICLNMTSSSDLNVNVTFPECVIIHVHDNDVAIVGFLNDSIIPLKEGRTSAKICVGFKHPVDSDVNISIPIKFRSTNYLPDAGHDLYIEKPSITLDAKNPVSCSKVDTKYDTNIKGSMYNISFVIQESSALNSNIIVEENILEITVEDSHGISFESEPTNISVGIGKDAYFPCVYRGSNTIPHWNISSVSEQKIASINRLPPKHYYNGTGLIVWRVDASQNMTSYSCLFQLFDHDLLTTFSSNVATLTVLEDISFNLTMKGVNSSKRIDLLEGDSAQKLTISKTGHTLDTYLILVAILKDYEGYCGFGYVDIEWFMFEGEKSNYLFNIPFVNELQDDHIPERLKVFSVNISTAEVIKGENNARVIIDEPMIISLYDNDVSVGFTNQTITIAEQSVGKICMKPFNEIHPSIIVSFDLIETGDFPTGLNISSRKNQFTNSNNHSEVCINLTFDNQECDKNKIFVIHIVNISHPDTVTVYIHHPNITVYTTDKNGDCGGFCDTYCVIVTSMGASAGFVTMVMIIIILLLVITLITFHKKRLAIGKKERQKIITFHTIK